MIGKTISHYKILDKLGEGGMGVVYKAEDTKLKRTVALKFLSPQALGGEEDRARFVHEAQAAASLSHPNICTIHEIDESEGQSFIAMEYLEGRSLKDKIEAGPMKLSEAMDLAIQIAEALQKAHGKDIVHRDIKPANIMVTSEGKAKIMDFGLAKSAKGVDLTKTGTTIGTVAYMSPEQAKGEEVDHRTDIWSLGAVLYELATGQKPFKGHYEHAVIYSILNQDPESTTALRPGLPAELERIVKKALAKKVSERYQHMADFLVDLKSLREGIKASAAESHLERRRLLGSIRIVLYATVGVVLIALVVFKMGLFRSASTTIDSVAVLPLENLSGEPEQDYFADGMTEALIANLAKIRSLKVISRTSVMRYRQTDRSLPDIARELNVDAVVEGTVLRAGDRVRITAQLIEGQTDQNLWAESYERDLQDVLALQSDVARAIAKEIEVKLTSREKAQLVGGAAVNPEAYEAYLMGRYHWNQRNEKALWKSIEYFQTALEKDPDYALAYVALAEAYIVLGDWNFYPASEAYPKGREFAEKALEYEQNLAEAHAALADVKYMYDWDWPAAYVGFRRAIELTPNYATAHQWYAECLCAAGRYDEALGEIDRALELDPFSLIMLTMKANILYTAGRLGEALEEFQRVIEMDPDFVGAHTLLSLLYLCEGMYDDAVEEYTKFMRLMGVSEERLTKLKRAYETSGIVGLSRWQLERFERRSKEGYVNPIEITLAYATLDDMDRAFEWLERAREERSAIMAWITVDPRFDIMRSDPRFDALVKRMELKF